MTGRDAADDEDLESTVRMFAPDFASEETPEAEASRAQRARLYDLFQLTVDLPPEEREARIATECAGDPELERELRGLLDMEATLPPDFLEHANLGLDSD